ncbi:BLUF domain-containing protein [Methylibium sp. T29]|uniref:BLUF domain-containing protein n=1 Tax=Methylibium sp. T29 TaxID=1430884 RepID=UPI0009DF3A5C|nr:BLUF domain-containing protein [Methylibium sp. T29]
MVCSIVLRASLPPEPESLLHDDTVAVLVSQSGPRRQAFETIAVVVAEARQLNAEQSITGVLVFDGAQVCQYVEGEVGTIDALIERLMVDPRHEQLKVLHHATLQGERRFARWRLGYLMLDDGRDLTRFDALSGEGAIASFLEQLPLVDLEP